jgi:hypothetical protein
MPLIAETVTTNSTIYSDKYSVYVDNRRNISKLQPLLEVDHYWVNHTNLFVDRNDNKFIKTTLKELDAASEIILGI